MAKIPNVGPIIYADRIIEVFSILDSVNPL